MPTASQWMLALPWVALLLLMPIMLLRRPRLASFPPPFANTDDSNGAAIPDTDVPLVSIIVPARNEAVNISVCVASLLTTLYPNFEIVVVDDDSTDGTADIVKVLAEHSDGRVQLVAAPPLPAGWLGKPWACRQGYIHARGDLLLFTDADTRHEDSLLGHAVGAMQVNNADMVSILPRQLMFGFWERVIMPHIFALISLRFIYLGRVNRTRNSRNVIANGQFILVRRDAYEAIGTHEALRNEVVEDQALAQRLVAERRSIFVAHAERLMETRMYRSFRTIVNGWSRNLAVGSRNAAPAWLGVSVPWLIAAFLILMWVIPPVTLLATLFTPLNGAIRGWALAVTATSLLFWLLAHIVQRVPVLYVVTYPLGAFVAALIFIRSAIRGARVVWKGREYDVADGQWAGGGKQM